MSSHHWDSDAVDVDLLDAGADVGAVFDISGNSKKTNTVATAPIIIHAEGEAQAFSPAARPTRPAKTIPVPTPAKTMPDHCCLSCRARIGIAHAETPTSRTVKPAATPVADAGTSLHDGDRIKTMFAEEFERLRVR